MHCGWPEKILTDQGRSFEDNLIQELCELAQVKKLRTSPYHQIAQENSQRESEHKKYYDKRMRCVSLRRDDLVLVCTKAPSGNHKIAD